MPKDSRRRTSGHAQSVRLHKQKHEPQPELGTDAVSPIHDIGDSSLKNVLSVPEDDIRKSMKKKKKQALKHETFLQRLEASRSPYSRSHERRLKRKAREQVAGGLQDITAALAEVETEMPIAVQHAVSTDDNPTAEETARRPKSVPGLIGEGKHKTLNKSQRKRALQAERMRIPLILSNPEFSANPFKTIRTHAQNTLVKREGSK